MGRRSFDVVDLTELFVHWEAGRSQVQIGESLSLDRKTVRKYLAPAVAEGLVPGGPPAGEQVWAQRIGRWFPELADARLRQVTWPAIEAHRDYIVEQLADEVTVSTISSRLIAEKGLTASESSVRRWIAANLAEETARRRVSVPRGPVDPGSEAQIDYGKLGSWTDPATGTRHTIQAFVMVLACSRMIFVRPVIRLDQTSWCDSHVGAFAFFGGVPARLVPDNLKTGVDRPDLYDPRINRAYAELAVHYGVLADPARAFKPKDKPRVERAMPYVRDSFWRGREFTSLEADAGRGDHLVPAGRERPVSPVAGRRQPAVGVRRRRSRGAETVAAQRVRGGHLVDWEDRAGLPPQGRSSVVFGAVAVDRATGRRPRRREHRADPAPGQGRRHPRPAGPRPGHRFRALPAGEDRVPHANPGLVPAAGREDRPRHHRGHRPTDGSQRPAPAPLRAGHHRPRRATGSRAHPTGSGVRPGADRRRPQLPHHQRHPRRGHRDTHPGSITHRDQQPGLPPRARRTPRPDHRAPAGIGADDRSCCLGSHLTDKDSVHDHS